MWNLRFFINESNLTKLFSINSYYFKYGWQSFFYFFFFPQLESDLNIFLKKNSVRYKKPITWGEFEKAPIFHSDHKSLENLTHLPINLLDICLSFFSKRINLLFFLPWQFFFFNLMDGPDNNLYRFNSLFFFSFFRYYSNTHDIIENISLDPLFKKTPLIENNDNKSLYLLSLYYFVNNVNLLYIKKYFKIFRNIDFFLDFLGKNQNKNFVYKWWIVDFFFLPNYLFFLEPLDRFFLIINIYKQKQNLNFLFDNFQSLQYFLIFYNNERYSLLELSSPHFMNYGHNNAKRSYGHFLSEYIFENIFYEYNLTFSFDFFIKIELERFFFEYLSLYFICNKSLYNNNNNYDFFTEKKKKLKFFFF